MSLVKAFYDWLSGKPPTVGPKYSVSILSDEDQLIVTCPLEVVASDPDWGSTELKSSRGAFAHRTAVAQYCVLKRDGEPVAFMTAKELLSTCDMETADIVSIESLRVQFGTTAVRTLP